MLCKYSSFIAGRALIGYFLFEIYFVLRTDASSLKQRTVEICSPAGMKTVLSSENSISTDDVELLYIYCRDKFLDSHKLSSNVKQTVDEWIGTDLSRAEANEIFLALELALVSPKPERISESFELDCKNMSEKFQSFYDTIEPLTNYFDINMDSLLANEDDEIDDQERELFNYVQYSQFCKLILSDE